MDVTSREATETALPKRMFLRIRRRRIDEDSEKRFLDNAVALGPGGYPLANRRDQHRLAGLFATFTAVTATSRRVIAIIPLE